MPLARIVTPADHSAFVALRQRSLEAHPECFATTAEAWRSAPQEQTRAMLEDSADLETGSAIFGAFEGDLVGLLGFKRDPRGSVDHYATLWGVFVAEGSRGHGCGGALLDAALAYARRLSGLDYVRLGVPLEREPAVRLFESRGFTHYGLEPGAAKLGARRIDRAYMRIGLAGA